MNTIITEKTPNGDVTYDVFSKLVSDRVLFICDYIDDRAATDIVAALLYLDGTDPETKISLYINSEGGDVRSVFMIYDIMCLISAPIETICLGSATFEPAILLAAGTAGMRSCTKSSLLCISQLSSEGAQYVDMTDAKISFEQLKKDNHRIIDVLSLLTGKKKAIVMKDCERKLYLTPLQAKRYGLIDHVLDWKK